MGYWAAKEYGIVIDIMGENGWIDQLMEKVRSINKLEKKRLLQAVTYFRKGNHHEYAKETYIKLGDIKSLLTLYVDQHKWQEAFDLSKDHPDVVDDSFNIYLPYAEWLALNDRFDEAHQAFTDAGK